MRGGLRSRSLIPGCAARCSLDPAADGSLRYGIFLMSYRVCFSLSFLKCPAVEAASRGCALSFNNSSPEFADLSVFCDGGRVSLRHHYGGFLVPVRRCRTGRQICAGDFAFKSGGIRCANVPFFAVFMRVFFLLSCDQFRV